MSSMKLCVVPYEVRNKIRDINNSSSFFGFWIILDYE